MFATHILSVVVALYVFNTRVACLFRSSTFSVCDGKKGAGSTELQRESSETNLECGSLCLKHEECQSANFDKLTGVCILLEDGFKSDQNRCDDLNIEKNTVFLFRNDYPCYFGQPYVGSVCVCGDGFTGDFCENPPRDCTGLTNGVHDIYIYPTTWEATRVECFQQAVSIFDVMDGVFDDANAGWNDFKNGFETATGDYWMGNEKIHRLSSYRYNYTLYLGVSWGMTSPMMNYLYNFVLGNEASNYTIAFSRFERNAGSTADNAFPNDRPFRTFDHTDDNCVANHNAAFWYTVGCPRPSPLLGTYPFGGSLLNLGLFRGFLKRE